MTNEQKLSVLMAYLGQKVKWNDDDYHYKLVGISIYESMIQVVLASGITDWWSDLSCSLLLRTVEQMTDEEIDIFWELNKDILFGGNRSYIRLYISQSINAITTPPKIKCIDYLRSIGIATDVMGITVQEMVKAGIVTLNQVNASAEGLSIII
jgi:hypothetical protein